MARRLSKKSSIRLQIAAEQKWTCQHCKQLLLSTFEIDHIQPLSHGGKDILKNLQALCANCHRSKTSPERQWLADEKIETQTGISKYFNPNCISYYRIRS